MSAICLPDHVSLFKHSRILKTDFSKKKTGFSNALELNELCEVSHPPSFERRSKRPSQTTNYRHTLLKDVIKLN